MRKTTQVERDLAFNKTNRPTPDEMDDYVRRMRTDGLAREVVAGWVWKDIANCFCYDCKRFKHTDNREKDYTQEAMQKAQPKLESKKVWVKGYEGVRNFAHRCKVNAGITAFRKTESSIHGRDKKRLPCEVLAHEKTSLPGPVKTLKLKEFNGSFKQHHSKMQLLDPVVADFMKIMFVNPDVRRADAIQQIKHRHPSKSVAQLESYWRKTIQKLREEFSDYKYD